MARWVLRNLDSWKVLHGGLGIAPKWVMKICRSGDLWEPLWSWYIDWEWCEWRADPYRAFRSNWVLSLHNMLAVFVVLQCKVLNRCLRNPFTVTMRLNCSAGTRVHVCQGISCEADWGVRGCGYKYDIEVVFWDLLTVLNRVNVGLSFYCWDGAMELVGAAHFSPYYQRGHRTRMIFEFCLSDSIS